MKKTDMKIKTKKGSNEAAPIVRKARPVVGMVRLKVVASTIVEIISIPPCLLVAIGTANI